MKRVLSILAMGVAVLLFVATTPLAPTLHGPIVTRVEGTRGSGDVLLVALTGNPILVRHSVEVDGEVTDIPEGQEVLLVHLRVSTRDVPTVGTRVSLVIDGNTYASDERLDPLSSLTTLTLGPGLWTLGTVPFRLPAGLLDGSPDIRVEVSDAPFDARSLSEVISLPLLGDRLERDHAEIPSAGVVGTWDG